MNKSSILVTGGSGLVGNALKKISVNYLDKYNFIFLSSKDCDLSDFNSTKLLFEKYKPEYIIHLAAYVGGLFKNINNKVDMFEKNVQINYNIIRCSHMYNVKKLISCLSTCIFPDKIEYPIHENMLHNGPPHDSNYAYAYSKRMLELHSKIYRESYGNNFICITPCNVYGPFDNFSLEDGHVLPALIHKCYNAKNENKKFIVKGTGKPLRDFTFASDAAKIILWLAKNYNGQEPINIGNPEEISIKNLSEMIGEEIGFKGDIIFDHSKPDGQYRKPCSNLKLRSLGWDQEYTPLSDGLKLTVRNFMSRYPDVRGVRK